MAVLAAELAAGLTVLCLLPAITADRSHISTCVTQHIPATAPDSLNPVCAAADDGLIQGAS